MSCVVSCAPDVRTTLDTFRINGRILHIFTSNVNSCFVCGDDDDDVVRIANIAEQPTSDKSAQQARREIWTFNSSHFTQHSSVKRVKHLIAKCKSVSKKCEVD